MIGGAPGRRAALLLVFVALLAAPAAAQRPRIVGPGDCTNSKCHVSQGTWWRGDPHRTSADPFVAGKPGYLAMAEAYGIPKGDARAINEKCISCHGTVLVGEEARPPEFGVSCESCHGPGERYLESHQRGYDLGVKDGMAAFHDRGVRADACVRCHLVTDQKLLDVDHPPGWPRARTFSNKISLVASPPNHWKELTAADSDPGPFEEAIRRRGPVPERGGPGETALAGEAAAGGGGGSSFSGGTRVVKVFVKGGDVFPLTSPAEVKPLDLEEFARPPAEATTPEILTLLQNRLRYLYRRLDETYPD